MREFTEREKTMVLEDIDIIGNVSKVAEKWGVSRQTIYNWKSQREDIDIGIALREQSDEIQKSRNIDFMSKMDKYADLLKKAGTIEERKDKMANKVEYLNAKVIDILENHPDLEKLHPKDLSKIMTDLHGVKKELRNEPTVIIEYKQQLRMQTVQILQDFLDKEQIIEFGKRMKAVEAEYEVI